MSGPIPMVDQQIRLSQIKFTEPEVAEFVRLAQAAGSGVGKALRKAGSLESLYEVLKKGCTIDAFATELRLLAGIADPMYGSKANKYKAAVYYLERISSLSEHLRISVKPKASSAVKFGKAATGVTANCVWKEFVDGQGVKKLGAEAVRDSLQLAAPSASDDLAMTVEDYMLKNPRTTRLYLIHMGGYQDGMEQTYDGRSCIEHINSVLELGAKLRIHLAILQDPAMNAVTKSAGAAVFAGLMDQVGSYAVERVKVVNAGRHHSGFGDATFQAWVEEAGVTAIVVMGFDADVCVHANVFGSSQFVDSTAPLGTTKPPQLVPSLLEKKDIVTSRPLLIGRGKIQKREWGPLQNT